MTALDFPNSPTVGQVFTSGGSALSYMWDGTRWRIAGAGGSPSGRIGYAQITANQGGFGAPVAGVSGLSVSWTADPSRTYRTTVSGLMLSTAASDVFLVHIWDSVANSSKQMTSVPLPSSAGHNAPVWASIVESGLSGNQIRGVAVQRGVGSGTVTWSTGPTVPSYILVEDITYQPGGGGGTAVSSVAPGGLAQRGVSSGWGSGAYYSITWQTWSYLHQQGAGSGVTAFTLAPGIWMLSGRVYTVTPVAGQVRLMLSNNVQVYAPQSNQWAVVTAMIALPASTTLTLDYYTPSTVDLNAAALEVRMISALPAP